MTQADGVKCYEADYLPYGQENNILNGCSSAYKFTGYEYDSESGNSQPAVHILMQCKTRGYRDGGLVSC
jgi:hypothetical protein